MSGSEGGPGRREVAVRCFAAEFEDAELEYSESDEERAPNYVVTPTGVRINRLFVVGVLTEVESVSEDVLRGRVVDPTGAFVVYAGQYQPEAKTFLERAEPPRFVAVTGKARTFRPDEGDRVFTSIRPESINDVDSATRDRWTVQTAEHTVERVAACAAALDRPERGADLETTLHESGIDPALAAGIPRAIDHYGTTPAYLAAVRRLAIQAAEVVTGDRSEVDALETAPDEDAPVEADLAGDVSVEPAPAPGGTAGADDASSASARDERESAEPSEAADAPAADEAEPAPDSTGGTTDASAADATDRSAADEVGDVDPTEADTGEGADETGGPSTGEVAAGAEPTGAEADPDELYEVDEDERQQIEAEYGTEFSTGSEVDDPGEADIETPQPAGGDEAGSGDAAAADESPTGPDPDEASAAETGAGANGDAVGGEGGNGGDEAAPSDAGDAVDLEDAVVEAMASLDDGEGAEREAVVAAVVDEHEVDPDAVEAAIQDALMGGRCYEPEDDRLKAI